MALIHSQLNALHDRRDCPLRLTYPYVPPEGVRVVFCGFTNSDLEDNVVPEDDDRDRYDSGSCNDINEVEVMRW